MSGKCDHRWNKRIKVEKDGITYKCMVCREVYKLPGRVSESAEEVCERLVREGKLKRSSTE